MTMSPLFMVFALIAASWCRSGDCSDTCSKSLPDNLMLRTLTCLAGYYKKGSCQENNSKMFICEKCGKETFTAYNNTLFTCNPCNVCGTDEIVETECTSQNNRKCICKQGLYRSKAHSISTCENCTSCTNCSTCPECKSICDKKSCEHGQFLDQMGKCQSCADHNCLDKSCKPFCDKVPDPSTTWVMILGITLSTLLLLGLFTVFYFACKGYKKKQLHRRAQIKFVHESPASDNGVQPNMPALPDQPAYQQNIFLPLNVIPVRAVNDPGTGHQQYPDLHQTGHITAPLIINEVIKELSNHELEKEIWPASLLYTIIRHVPVRRWKEFLRLLSVSDDQMERMELEAKGSYLELQYQMLRLWTQMNGACLENIYSTLHYMDLSGCAEDLQEKLKQLQETMV